MDNKRKLTFSYKRLLFQALNSKRQILVFWFLYFFFVYVPKYSSQSSSFMQIKYLFIWLICTFLHLFFCFRELCTKLYSMSWGNTQSWQEFDRFCEYNPVEVSMLTCLADVREPCQLGCRNLTYCTNFNNRQEQVTIHGIEVFYH